MDNTEETSEVVKNFIWKFKCKEDAENFDSFRLLMMTKFSSVEIILSHWIKNYLDSNKIDFTLLLEPDAVLRLEADGLKTSRNTLKKYRDYNVLLDDKGKQFWFTDGHNIAYNYELLKEFVITRKSAGVSKLVNEED